MDGISAASVAEELGTSVPRVVRAVERLGMEEARGANGRLQLNEAQRKLLREHLGVTPRVPRRARRAHAAAAPPRRSRRVPPRLRHLFWDSKPAGLDVQSRGAFIALRLLRLLDPEGLAWGVANLRPSDWRRAGRARGLPPPVRALATNLAAGGDGG